MASRDSSCTSKLRNIILKVLLSQQPVARGSQTSCVWTMSSSLPLHYTQTVIEPAQQPGPRDIPSHYRSRTCYGTRLTLLQFTSALILEQTSLLTRLTLKLIADQARRLHRVGPEQKPTPSGTTIHSCPAIENTFSQKRHMKITLVAQHYEKYSQFSPAQVRSTGSDIH